MRLGMHMLELLVKAVRVPRNILNHRLESKPIPVLYHVYSFYSNWQVSLILPGGSRAVCRIPLPQNQTLARPFSVLAAIPAQGCFEEPLILCWVISLLGTILMECLTDHRLFHTSPALMLCC